MDTWQSAVYSGAISQKFQIQSVKKISNFCHLQVIDGDGCVKEGKFGPLWNKLAKKPSGNWPNSLSERKEN